MSMIHDMNLTVTRAVDDDEVMTTNLRMHMIRLVILSYHISRHRGRQAGHNSTGPFQILLFSRLFSRLFSHTAMHKSTNTHHLAGRGIFTTVN